MKVSILGSGPLANATAHCCRQQRHSVMAVPDPTSDLYWFCEDTPIDSDGVPDVEYALAHIMAVARSAPPISELMLVSSQLPVGSVARLEQEFPRLSWVCIPENLRHATAVFDFEHQDRIVVGIRDSRHCDMLRSLLAPFTKNIIFCEVETAEFIKSATNVWLAANIALANELATLCEKAGANPLTAASALRMDSRLAPKVPGGPYSGGHLEREVFNLRKLGDRFALSLPLLESIDESNSWRKQEYSK